MPHHRILSCPVKPAVIVRPVGSTSRVAFEAAKKQILDVLSDKSDDYFGVRFKSSGQLATTDYGRAFFYGDFNRFTKLIKSRGSQLQPDFWNFVLDLVLTSLEGMPTDTHFRVSFQVSTAMHERQDALGVHRDSYRSESGTFFPLKSAVDATSGELKYKHFPYRMDMMRFEESVKFNGSFDYQRILECESNLRWDVRHRYDDGAAVFNNLMGIHDVEFSLGESRLAVVIQLGDVPATDLPMPDRVALDHENLMFSEFGSEGALELWVLNQQCG